MAMQIPGYRVVRKINQGGMSTVYLAIQISVGRVVALKVMNPQLNNDPAFSERFQREATIVGQLSHPNIVAIYDIGRHEDFNYIAMDYLPNGSVHDKMSTGLSGEEVLRITREIASALDHAHDKGYIHRDIKPENILFRADNSAVLTDFGVARGLAVNSRMTHVGTVVGTPHYMSPEQTKGSSVDGRSDLYSLGVVFYEMLTGTLPYQGEEAVTIALKHISAPIPKLPLQYLAYQKVLEKLLAKNPDQRYQSGRELIAAIDDLENNYRVPNTTTAHSTDLTVVNLAKALASATYNAVRFRWNKIRALRWNPNRGFYSKPSTKITEIFFNEQHTPLTTARAELETQVHPTISPKQSALIKLGILTGIFILIGAGIWFTQQNPSANHIPVASVSSVASSAQLQNPSSTEDNSSSSTQGSAQVSDAETNTVPALLAPIDMSPEIFPTSATSSSTSAEDEITASSAPVITYALRVTTSPAQSRVRILNIPEKYEPGIQLPAGRYHLEISKSGYDIQYQWIELIDQDLNLAFTLSESLVPGEEISSQVITSIKSDGPEMIGIPSGSFFMGNKNDPLSMPVHKVTISKPFAISKYEITFNDYDIFAQATNRALPSDNRWGRDNRPAINVSFEDARAYAAWLSKTTGKKYRLPTESEWEYVARGKTNSLFWWGDDVKEASGRANCRRGCNSKFSGLFGAKTAPVGSYPANGFGVYDTAGNVAEWVEDCFADNYSLHPKNGQAMLTKSCDTRVVRGGSSKDNADRLASHLRDYHRAEIFDAHLGFRVVMEGQ
ncbi:bifunctional serine/threonine-protein kinase/formylglycine-generating enzyme family protein [Cellvibrio sp. NN19]|uniref:bifunctional serine/threonine-protein kinase/formylglycine-generating enzyme family protein n=1 Tax=Cellvibrio chitinivorans TaxID=3102792 RepID=UPI002B411910|nr:bifunctional serine/threonine-protein kinase/formylglycine-generating enzyme family protein [Cellvibrio sp. NN19]